MGYLIAVGVAGLVWLAFFVFRKDVRSKMLWCGAYCAVVLSVGFLILRILFLHVPVSEMIVPGYWDPDTLFDIARITGGWSIEDTFYMFFTGGIAAVLYDVVRNKKVLPVTGSLFRRRKMATRIPAVGVFAMALLLPVNFIWELIAFCAIGAIVIWYARPDLLTRSLVGGASYAFLYYTVFSFLLFFSPTYVTTHYNIPNLSGVFLGPLPLEEILFAFVFGLMWASLYEYAKDIRPGSRSPCGARVLHTQPIPGPVAPR